MPSLKRTIKKKSTAVSKTATSNSAKQSRVRRSLPTLFTVGVSVLIVAGIGLLPAKTWISQRQSISDTQSDLDRLNAEVAELEVQLQLLETDDEIERTARENFDFVYPGEESYRILPAPEVEESN